jgi:uncharacterized protein YyaL (SSP411 family)
MYWIYITGLILAMLPMMAVTAYSENSENRIHLEVQKRLASGEKTNRLIDQQSPYLLQHAFNPVDWYPWGEEAFSRARKENKPIFLSIGYSTCHWCHVMAHESFENPEIAAILNNWFISIKVDREERPDIDQMYMAATQAMTGSGGWPMSVFLLPDGSPFYAGTYFPPKSVGKRPGFGDLLGAIHTAWQENKDKINETADRLVTALNTGNIPSDSSIKADVLERGYSLLEKSYDSKRGGFGQAPKFPRPVIFSFLFSYYAATGESRARDIALDTLQKMAAGGMYDQLGGGFHRYSVDAQWFVPHFEKMLYDQAQLVNSYLDGFLITGNEEYSVIARDILDYTLRDMHDPAGGFYSAEDADSDNPYAPGEHGEGAFYLWTKENIDKQLGQRAAGIFNKRYGVKDDGNVDQDPMEEFTGRNILYLDQTDDEVAAGLNLNRQEIVKSLKASKKELFKIRQQRRRPHLDDKVITAWNGMMIGALARAGTALNAPELLAEAVRTATFIEDNLYTPVTGTLLRRYREQQAGLTGQLDDHSYLVSGLLELYQASHDPKWLRWSMELTERQIELFWNETGGFFFDSAADSSIKIRMRERYDGAEPAGNSVAVHNLLRLGQLYNKPEWLQMARRLMGSFSETINQYPPSLPLMLAAWQHIDSKASQIVIAGKRDAEDTKAMLRIAYTYFSPNRLILLADGEKNQLFLADNLPFMENVKPIGGKATAYVCSDFTCKMPVTDPTDLKRQLDEQNR